MRHAALRPATTWLLAVLLVSLGSGCASARKRDPDAPSAAEAPVVEAAAEIEDPGSQRYRACRRESADRIMVVDDTQALLEETGCRAALWLDGLFGEDNVDAAQRTNGYLETAISHSEFEGTDFRTRLRVRFDLPNVKERLSAFVGREDEDDFIRGRSEGFALRSQFPRVNNEDQWLAGLGYSLPGNERLQTGIKVGASSLTAPRVFVQGRVHYNVYADASNLVYVRLTPFWNSRIGFGVTSGIDYNYLLTPALLARWANVGTVSESTEGLDWLSALILYQNLREQRAMAYELFIRGQTQAEEPLYEYGARTIYRHPFVKDRFYGEFVLGYSFPRTDPTLPRNGSYEIGFGLELPFGRRDD
ncbi:MAG TPA: hypothetical protein VGE57_11250 [Solimonas sp.]